MKRKIRFLINGGWTRWHDDGADDLSFLRDNKEITAVEVTEEMTREEAEKYLRDIHG